MAESLTVDEWAGDSHSLMNYIWERKLICEEYVKSKQEALSRCQNDVITVFSLKQSTLLIVCWAINSELCEGVQGFWKRLLQFPWSGNRVLL